MHTVEGTISEAPFMIKKKMPVAGRRIPIRWVLTVPGQPTCFFRLTIPQALRLQRGARLADTW
jgi:hypothetical protein